MIRYFPLLLLQVFLVYQLDAQTIERTYDPLDRLTVEVYPDSSIVTYKYDKIGNLLEMKVVDPCSTRKKPAISPSGPLTICSGDTLSLSTSAGLAYQWSTGDTSNQTIKVSVAGIYSVTKLDSFRINNDTIQCYVTSDPISVIVKQVPVVTTPLNIVVCNGIVTTPLNFTSSIPNTTFNWAGTTNTIGIAQNGNGNIPTFTAINTGNTIIVDTITVIPVADGCVGSAITFTITVNPTPNIIEVNNQIVCNGFPSAIVNFNSDVNNTSYSWINNTPAIGLAPSGNSTIPSFATINNIALPVNATIQVIPMANSCLGSSRTFSITVNPTPTINAVANQSLCNGETTATIIFSGNAVGTIYNWTNNQPSIGLASGGTGNIPAFIGTNNTAAPVIATIAVTPIVNNCAGIPISFTITVNPTPVLSTILDKVICNNSSVTMIGFTSNVAGASYNWSNNLPSIGLAANGVGDIPSFTATNVISIPITGTIIVSPTANNCTGQSRIFSITVNPTPTINPIASQIVCNGELVSAVNFNGAVNGTTYNWSNTNSAIGLALMGAGNILSYVGTNSGNVPVIANITAVPLANGCGGPPAIFAITVNPTPTANPISDQVLCNGENTTTVNFTGSVGGSLFYWSNNNTTIGLSTAGIGNINSFIALNPSSVLKTASLVVIPQANGCLGESKNFSFTVKPTPVVNNVADLAVCNGDMITVIPFNGLVNGTNFSWVNSDVTIGIPAAGSGDISFVIATNLTFIPVVSQVTVTPFANSCVGQAKTFAITVKPTPNIESVTSQVKCDGFNSDNINFTGSVSGTNFNWTNTNTSIGLAASGTGNIPSFATINNSVTPKIGYIMVQPFANGCIGLSQTFSVQVNPIPNVIAPENITICNNDTARFNEFYGLVPGTTYYWANNNASVGLSANGTGNILPFAALNNLIIPKSAMIEVTPVANSCVGNPDTMSITVKPTPTVNQNLDQEICNYTKTDSVMFLSSVVGTTYVTWTDNLHSMGFVGDEHQGIPSFIAKNFSDTQYTANIKVTPFANLCLGKPDTFTITVNPTPKVNPIQHQTLCTGDSSSYVNLTGNVAFTTFGWTNNDSSIGLTNTGIGNIPKFKTSNITDTIITSIVTITPVAHSCIGTQSNFSFTIKPHPKTDTISDYVLCNGSAFSVLGFSGPVANTKYQWTNSDTSIGLTDTGLDSIGAFTVFNKANNPVISSINVTPFANNCVGDSMTFNIRVNPTPILETIPNIVQCNNDVTDSILFKASTDSTIYLWENDNELIGLSSSGANNIMPFTAKNIKSVQQKAIVTVKPIAYGCPGLSQMFGIYVNPTLTPQISINANTNLICEGMLDTFTSTIVYGGSSPSYLWKINGKSTGTMSGQYISNSLANNDIVTCELSSNEPCADPRKVESAPVYIIVKSYLTPIADVIMTPSTSVNLWQPLVFGANVIHGGTSPIYQWQRNGIDIQGAKENTYTGKTGIDLLPKDVICLKIKSNETCLYVDTASDCSMPLVINNNSGIFDYVTLNPNPNNGKFTIQGNIYTEKDIKIKVLDASGKLMYMDILLPIKNTIYAEIKLDEYANGTYYLWLTLDKENKSIRFVISR